jgi:hypothetical protein
MESSLLHLGEMLAKDVHIRAPLGAWAELGDDCDQPQLRIWTLGELDRLPQGELRLIGAVVSHPDQPYSKVFAACEPARRDGDGDGRHVEQTLPHASREYPPERASMRGAHHDHVRVQFLGQII